MPSSLKFLWVYSAADAWTMAWHTRLLKSRRDRGFDIKGFCTTIPYLKGRWLPFPELNYLWKVGDRALMQMYSDLAEQLEDRDVLILYNGANLHPLYVNWLRVMKVYTAGDPESESVLSRSVAPGFNVHLVNHVPSVDTYRGWGLKHVYFWPLGSLAFEEDVADLDEETICDITNRPLTIAFFNERSTELFPTLFVLGVAGLVGLWIGRRCGRFTGRRRWDGISITRQVSTFVPMTFLLTV